MKITFLGTNGWFNTKTGNTVSTFVETKDYYIVFDAGDGIQRLAKLAKANKPVYLFMSHLHIDHVTGLHILPLLKIKVLNIILPKGRKKDFLKLMNPPFAANVNFLHYPVNVSEITEGTHKIPFKVTAKKLKHMWDAFGYRLEIDEKIIAYCLDTGPCENSIKLAEKADVLIHECAMRPGVSAGEWGHTNPQEAAMIAKKAKAKKLVLTHFDASQYISLDDRQSAQRAAAKIFKNTISTKDGQVIIL
jgi:ribonuclease BN (tRNA processing enzyme)